MENAFKYVGGDYRIHIDAKARTNEVAFSVSNSLPFQPPAEKHNGIGLENLKRRLALLYPDKHKLTIHKENNTFVATLILTINQ